MLVKLDHFFQFSGWKHKDYLKPSTSYGSPPPKKKNTKTTQGKPGHVFFPRNFPPSQVATPYHGQSSHSFHELGIRQVTGFASLRPQRGGGCGWWGVKASCFCLKCWWKQQGWRQVLRSRETFFVQLGVRDLWILFCGFTLVFSFGGFKKGTQIRHTDLFQVSPNQIPWKQTLAMPNC